MSDLTDHMRQLAPHSPIAGPLLKQAADEIDRLRRWKSTHTPRLEALEGLLKHAQLEAAKGAEAVASLDSEREANAILSDEIDKLRAELAKHQESEFHPDWSMLVATRESLAEHQQIITKLREKLTLAESVRSAQVAGLVEGAEKLEQDAARWRHVRDKCAWTATSANGMTRIAIRLPGDLPIEADDELDVAIDAALKGASHE